MDVKIIEKSCKKLCKMLISNVDKECIICKDINNDCVLLLPCSHYQLCNKCFHHLNQKKCPICRNDIFYYLEVDKDNSIKKINTNNYPDNSSDEEYEDEYLLYNQNNRHVPFQERVIFRRLRLASEIPNNNINNRFSTWWPNNL